MADRIQLRRDTAANWTSANPVLAQGELGIETDTSKFKVGNGSAAWSALGYLIDTGGYLTSSAIGATVQGYDADLASIAGLSGTAGLLKKTAANTWQLDTTSYLTPSSTIVWSTARSLWGNSVDGSADVTAGLRPASGTALNPAYGHSGAGGTGIYFPNANDVGIGAGGTERIRLYSSGATEFSGSVREFKVAIAASDISLAAGNYFTKTISGATTFTVSNVASSGRVSSFVLDLTNGGSATVNWFSGVKWAGGTAPTLTSAGRDLLGFFTHDGGTTWNGLVLGLDVK